MEPFTKQGLKKYLLQVYTLQFTSLLSTILLATYINQKYTYLSYVINNVLNLLVICIVSCVCAIYLAFPHATVYTKCRNTKVEHVSRPGYLQTCVFVVFNLSFVLLLVQLINYLNGVNTLIVPSAIIITTVSITSIMITAYNTNPSIRFFYILNTAVYNLLMIVSTVSIILMGMYFYTGNSNYLSVEIIISNLMFILFYLFNAYMMTFKIIGKYQSGDIDHIRDATAFYLNSINIFIKVAELINLRENRKRRS